MVMERTKTILLIIFPVVSVAGLVFASMAGMSRHEVSDAVAKIDSTPPSKPILELVSIRRGRGPVKQDDGFFMSSSTDDLGTVSIRVTSLKDDQTPVEQMGLRIINLNQSSEVGNQMLPRYDIRPFRSKNSGALLVYLHWIDGAQDVQEPISEKLAVFAIDLTGNISTEAATIVIVDPGRSQDTSGDVGSSWGE